jgi:hypothetical protein
MRIEKFIPVPSPEYQLIFSKDEGWTIAMALRDAYNKYPDAVDRAHWLKWANELDSLLRR